jgi:hypothetical protein
VPLTAASFLTGAGLTVGVLPALLMCYFPPRVKQYTEDGRHITSFVDNPTEQGLRAARRQTIAARAREFGV